MISKPQRRRRRMTQAQAFYRLHLALRTAVRLTPVEELERLGSYLLTNGMRLNGIQPESARLTIIDDPAYRLLQAVGAYTKNTQRPLIEVIDMLIEQLGSSAIHAWN